MIKTFFIFKFQIYQDKPYSWLHSLLKYKLFIGYIVILFLSIIIYLIPNYKIIYFISLLFIAFHSICLSLNIWNQSVNLITKCFGFQYLFFYYRTIHYFLSTYGLYRNYLNTYLFHFISRETLFICLQFKSSLILNLSIYTNTLIYILLFRILLLTINAEEIITLTLSHYKLQLNNFFIEVKIVTILAVQLLAFNFHRQKEVWKIYKSRGRLKIFSYSPILYLSKVYFQNNIHRIQTNSIILYNRTGSSISTSFIVISMQKAFRF